MNFFFTYPCLQRLNILLFDKKPLFLHNEQWTTATSIISINPQFLQTDIPNNSNFSVDINLFMSNTVFK